MMRREVGLVGEVGLGDSRCLGIFRKGFVGRGGRVFCDVLGVEVVKILNLVWFVGFERYR